MEETKALLFDLDGTLVDTEHLDDAAMSLVLSRHGLKKRKKFIGMTLDEYIKLISKNRKLKEKIKREFLKEYLSILRKTELEINNKISKILKGKTGTKTALVTSNNKELTNFILDKIRMKDFFDVVVTCEDTGNQKPHPDPYLRAVKELNVFPKDCLVFEDTLTGVKSAKAAGLKYIHIKNNKPK